MTCDPYDHGKVKHKGSKVISHQENHRPHEIRTVSNQFDSLSGFVLVSEDREDREMIGCELGDTSYNRRSLNEACLTSVFLHVCQKHTHTHSYLGSVNQDDPA